MVKDIQDNGEMALKHYPAHPVFILGIQIQTKKDGAGSKSKVVSAMAGCLNQDGQDDKG